MYAIVCQRTFVVFLKHKMGQRKSKITSTSLPVIKNVKYGEFKDLSKRDIKRLVNGYTLNLETKYLLKGVIPGILHLIFLYLYENWGIRNGITSGNGTSFMITTSLHDNINGIRIGCNGWINSIQICINNEWKQKYGKNTGIVKQFMLNENEYINYIISFFNGNVMAGIFVKTNKKRFKLFGKTSYFETIQPKYENEVLIGIKGKMDTYLKEIQYLWSEKTTKTSNSNKKTTNLSRFKGLKWDEPIGVNSNGSSFNYGLTINNNITGFKILWDSKIGTIQINADHEWKEPYGNSGNKSHIWMLNKGEYICDAVIIENDTNNIGGIAFQTNRYNIRCFGNTFKELFDDNLPKRKLINIKGTHHHFLNQIQLQWRYF